MNELTDKPPVKDKPLVGRTLQALREQVRETSRVLGVFEDDPARVAPAPSRPRGA